MKNILIIQSLQGDILILKNAILKNLPASYESIMWTDSFDHALDLIPKEGKFLVITSGIFHDISSVHKGRVKEKVLNQLKTPNILAEMILKINIKTMIYVFSTSVPKNLRFLDGYVMKDLKGVGVGVLLNIISNFESTQSSAEDTEEK